MGLGTEWNLLPGNQSIVFIENHDTERSGKEDILTYKKSQNYKVHTFTATVIKNCAFKIFNFILNFTLVLNLQKKVKNNVLIYVQ